MQHLETVSIMFIPIVGIVAIGALVAVAIWATQRRRERELHYRHERHRQLIDKGIGPDELAALMRAEERNRWASRREGLKLGGLLTTFTGIGCLIGLRFIEDEAIWLLGWVPTLAGLAILLYALILAPRTES